MKLVVKTMLLLLMLMPNHNLVEAQVLWKKATVLERLGPPTSTGIDDKGNEYFSYDEQVGGVPGGSYTRSTNLYFLPYEGLEVCSHAKIIYPSYETNHLVRYFQAEMVQEGYLEWKNHDTGHKYRLEVVKPFCVLYIWIEKDTPALIEEPIE